MDIVIFGVIIGLAVAMMLLFFLRSERLKDKLIKTEDALLQMANKDNYFDKKASLLRSDELSFYNTLQSIISDKFYIFPQVHLSDLVNIKNSSRDHENLYQLLGNKSVDYVVFTKPSMAPILAIELNGASHYAAQRQNRDKFVKTLFDSVGIKLLEVEKNSYRLEDLSEKIKLELSYHTPDV